MSTQYISRTVPLSYRGYATCDRCTETYYPEQPGQTTCKLCHTEQAFRTIRENDYAAKARKRAERKARKAA